MSLGFKRISLYTKFVLFTRFLMRFPRCVCSLSNALFHCIITCFPYCMLKYMIYNELFCVEILIKP